MSAPRPDLTLQDCPLPLGLAVSGGSDSMALLRRAAALHPAGVLRVATVDHGLRPEAAREARFVAEVCARLGLEHDILTLHLDSGGGLQARARDARYQALAGWAQTHRLGAVALGHTQTDVSEGFLLRLARGSGVDGLAAMRAEFTCEGMIFLRPLLGLTRVDLRAELKGIRQKWIDDPSNEDTRFGRAALRAAAPALAELGLSETRLADAAHWMRAASEVLEQAAQSWIKAHASTEHGDVILDGHALARTAEETRHRVLSRTLCAVSGQTYRPRFAALETLQDAIATTLHGCLIYRAKNTLRITREYKAETTAKTPRWQITGPRESGDIQTPLGEDGLNQLPNWRDTALLPRRSLLASPALWRKDRLIAAPLANPSDTWQAKLINPLHLSK